MAQILPGLPSHGPPPPLEPTNAKQAFADGPSQTEIDRSLHDSLLVPRVSLQLPCSIYGSAVLATTYVQEKTSMDWWQHVGTPCLLLFLNNFVQALMLVQLFQLVQWNRDALDRETECSELFPTFFFTYHALFFCVTLTEMSETWDLLMIVLVGIPTVHNWGDFLKYRREEDGSIVYASGGMTMLRKVHILVLVVLPKACFGVALTAIGGMFLQSSATNTDLALNSLAVVFILEVDEMLFLFLLPSTMRRLVEAVPPFEKEHPGYAYRVWETCVPFMKVLMAIVLVCAYWFTRQSCGTDPCENAIRDCPVLDF